MSLKDTMQADLLTIESDLGNEDGPMVFTWNGEDFQCHVSGDNTDATLESGGFSIAIDKVLIVRTDVFTDAIFPKQTQQLTFDGKTYRVDKVILNANKAFMKLLLTDPNRGV